MAIIYVLEIQDDDLPLKDSENRQTLTGQLLPTVGSNGSNIITTRESSLLNLSTSGPQRKSTSSSSSFVFKPTKKSRARHKTGKTSPATLVGPFLPSLKPPTNGKPFQLLTSSRNRCSLFTHEIGNIFQNMSRETSSYQIQLSINQPISQ